MRISDWSSDVCSSDLLVEPGFVDVQVAGRARARTTAVADDTAHEVGGRGFHEALADRGLDALAAAVGLNENNLGHGSERPYQSGGHIVKRQSTRRPYFRTGGVIADIEGLAMDWRLVRYEIGRAHV